MRLTKFPSATMISGCMTLLGVYAVYVKEITLDSQFIVCLLYCIVMAIDNHN